MGRAPAAFPGLSALFCAHRLCHASPSSHSSRTALQQQAAMCPAPVACSGSLLAPAAAARTPHPEPGALQQRCPSDQQRCPVRAGPAPLGPAAVPAPCRAGRPAGGAAEPPPHRAWPWGGGSAGRAVQLVDPSLDGKEWLMREVGGWDDWKIANYRHFSKGAGEREKVGRGFDSMCRRVAAVNRSGGTWHWHRWR